nr:AraC family transcriptional regulator [Acidobacteriota bacterium]
GTAPGGARAPAFALRPGGRGASTIQVPMKTHPAGDGHPVHGATLKAHDVSGLVMSETAYHPSLSIPPHRHEREAYFNFVLQGGFTEICGRRSYELGQSTLVFHAPGEVRSNQFHHQPTRLFNVRFDDEWLRRLPEQATILETSTRFTDGRLIKLAAKLYREFTNIDAVSPLIIEGVTLEMLGEAARDSWGVLDSRPPRWLLRVKELLHAHFGEGLKLSALAEAAGVHPAHLSRAFRQHFGCTVGDYVRRLRVECACRQLAASHTPLVEVASAAGFSDQSHFSRTFKRLTGQTPAQYRAAYGSR